MSTHANIVMPYGDFVVYKHFDGYPRSVLPQLMQVVGESSIFVRKRDNDPSSMLFNGSEEELLDEMGYLVCRIITFFAVSDYVRRTSTGLTFTPKDYSAVVSPTAICKGPTIEADYFYFIEKSGDITVQATGTGKKYVIPFKTDLSGVLEQLAMIGEDDPVDPR